MKKLQIPFIFRFDEEDKYDHIARIGWEFNRPSMNKAMDAVLFPKGWRENYKRLKSRQKKQGLPDKFFFSPQKKRSLGIKIRKGGRNKDAEMRKIMTKNS